jgi:hypothetical protein
MEELAQSIGNKKLPGEFDRDTATAVAACIGVTESLNCQIHAQTVALLANYLWRVSKSVFTESDLVFLRPRRNVSGYEIVAPHRAEIKK